jgi:Spy/CpxP family protein refolding chaperone
LKRTVLSDEQWARIAPLLPGKEGIAAGEEVIAAERALDRLFASRSVNEALLGESLARVSRAQARLRGVHLQAHLEQVRILTAQQVAAYNRLRGYGG